MQGVSSNLADIYDEAYYATRVEESARSAAVVVPLLIDLFPGMTSVVDVGCGTGAWLHQFQLLGVPQVLGIEGTDVPARLLQIERANVRRFDLREPLPPIGRFDLAISLEVADCLPTEAAETFVAGLTALSEVVVFSGAIPGQSVHPTLNERWASYWVGLFAAQRFVCFDVLRERLWYDQRVSWSYAQNVVVFASQTRDDISARLSSLCRRGPLDVVHPRAFETFRSEAHDERISELIRYPFHLVEEGCRGYNILRIDVDKFLALAQSEGAYSPEKLVAGGYTLAYVGASIEDAKTKIPNLSRPKTDPTKDEVARKRPKASKSEEERKRTLSREIFAVRLLEEGYKGFNILQIGVDQFLALGQAEGAYSPEKLAKGAYKRAYVAASAKEAKRMVKSVES